MSDIKTLLESEVLSEEVKDSLNTLINEQIQQAKDEAIQEAKNEMEVTYANKLHEEKQNLSEKMYRILDEMVKEEVEELKEDINYYRNLEVQYANKLETFKEQYAEELSEAFDQKIQEVVNGEFEELKEDIEESKKNHFGRMIYESFAKEFQKFGLGEDEQQLRNELEQLREDVQEKDKVIKENERAKKIESLLEDLEGRSRDIMATILENTDTDKLEERYNKTIDSVLSESNKGNGSETVTESDDSKEQKEGIVVNENEDGGSKRVETDDWSRTVRLATARR